MRNSVVSDITEYFSQVEVYQSLVDITESSIKSPKISKRATIPD